jgi:hypothetical protein
MGNEMDVAADGFFEKREHPPPGTTSGIAATASEQSFASSKIMFIPFIQRFDPLRAPQIRLTRHLSVWDTPHEEAMIATTRRLGGRLPLLRTDKPVQTWVASIRTGEDATDL